MARDYHGGGRFIPPGTQVRYSGGSEPEYGVVIHCWDSEEIGDFDCDVAFFGACFPAGPPSTKPYVLRYAALSLEPVDDRPRRLPWETDPKDSVFQKLKSNRIFWVLVALVKVAVTVGLVVALAQHWSCR